MLLPVQTIIILTIILQSVNIEDITSQLLDFGILGIAAIVLAIISYTFFQFFKKEIKRSQEVEQDFRDFLKTQNKYQAEIIKENTDAYHQFITYLKNKENES